MNVLEKIVAHKRLEIIENKKNKPVERLMQSTYFSKPCLSAKQYILDPKKSGIIAEFKRKSPSKGWIKKEAEIDHIIPAYQQANASCISILTDDIFFGGSTSDLTHAKEIANIPLLRKEFILDEYQLYEAKSIGADFILLIAEILNKEQIKTLSSKAKELGMEVLLEMHGEPQLVKICDTIDMIGINNRNLETFEVDLNRSIDLLNRIPDNFIKIAESGISSHADMKRLKEAGFHGFLIGEHFMKEKNPGKALETFINPL